MNAAVRHAIKVLANAIISQQKTRTYRVIYAGIKRLQCGNSVLN